MAIPFLKMQGLGNDFILIDDIGKPAALCHAITPELAKRMCDRRWGIGADQVLWMKTAQSANASAGACADLASIDARMDIYNPDGSIAEMCGNGIRAAALYLYRYGPKRKSEYRIDTLAGVKTVSLDEGRVRVDMGAPVLGAGFSGANHQLAGPIKLTLPVGERNAGAAVSGESPFSGEAIELAGNEFRYFDVDMGNPHVVLFVPDVDQCGIETLGPLMESHARFPRRTNVEFVEVVSPSSIRVRVWERGAGLTLACGTGACAAAVAALATGRVQGNVEVMLPGGSLDIRWDSGGPVFMEGPAEEVFRGEFFY